MNDDDPHDSRFREWFDTAAVAVVLAIFGLMSLTLLISLLRRIHE